MKPPNRQREIQLKFRVTPEERELIEQKMEQLGTTNMAAYLRKMAVDGYAVNLELPELRELVSLLRPLWEHGFAHYSELKIPLCKLIAQGYVFLKRSEWKFLFLCQWFRIFITQVRIQQPSLFQKIYESEDLTAQKGLCIPEVLFCLLKRAMVRASVRIKVKQLPVRRLP